MGLTGRSIGGRDKGNGEDGTSPLPSESRGCRLALLFFDLGIEGEILAALMAANVNTSRETVVSTLNTGFIWGIALVLGAAAGTVPESAGRHEEDSSSLERACAGLPTDRQLEDTLSMVRALSNDGFDPICGAVEARLTGERGPR